MRIAITRDVGSSLSGCELSFVPRQAIDVELAMAQHRDYRRALASLGCRVLELPAEPTMPDAVFVEDVALVLDEIAVITRPGAETRRAETASIAGIVSGYRPLRTIEAPATLDGGDVLRVGRTLYVGQSTRTNPDGIAQLQALVADHGYQVQAVAIRDCLHLKSAATLVASGTLLLQPEWVDAAVFTGLDIIKVDPGEQHAANALRVGDGVLYPACFPYTKRRLQAAGIAVTEVDVSELQKAEGAVTCCSLVFRDQVPVAA